MEDYCIVPHRKNVFFTWKIYIRVCLLIVFFYLLIPSVAVSSDLFRVTKTAPHARNEVVSGYRKDVAI